MRNYVAIEDCGLDVCHLEGSAKTDGRGLVCLYLAKHFVLEGFDVDLFTIGPREIHPHWRRYVNVRNVGDGPFPDKARDGTPYEAVFVNDWRVEGRLGSTPIVYQPHEIEALRVHRTGQSNEEAIAAQERMFGQCQVVLVPSTDIRSYVVENLGVPARRVILAPHGIDTAVFSPGDRCSARIGIGLEPAARVALFVGRIEVRKGLHVLRDAFALLPSDVQLMIIGEAKPEWDPVDSQVLGDLRGWIRANNYGQRVRLLGAVPWFDLPQYYRAADVVVLPSLMEPYGLPTAEALACGAPVVGSDIDGFRELIRHGEDGLLCPVGAGSAYAAAVMRVLEEPQWHTPSAIRARVRRVSSLGSHRTVAAVLEHLSAAAPAAATRLSF